MNVFRHFSPVLLAVLATAAPAADFDGSRPLICAPLVAIDCARGEECLSGLPEDIDAPAFMRFDFKKKQVSGARVASDILLLERSDKHLLLQGREGEYGWTIVIGAGSGDMTVTLATRGTAVVMHGSCTVD
ncbi:MAG TPA: hypothetical protein VF096_00605 [Azonexus sp.]